MTLNKYHYGAVMVKNSKNAGLSSVLRTSSRHYNGFGVSKRQWLLEIFNYNLQIIEYPLSDKKSSHAKERCNEQSPKVFPNPIVRAWYCNIYSRVIIFSLFSSISQPYARETLNCRIDMVLIFIPLQYFKRTSLKYFCRI